MVCLFLRTDSDSSLFKAGSLSLANATARHVLYCTFSGDILKLQADIIVECSNEVFVISAERPYYHEHLERHKETLL